MAKTTFVNGTIVEPAFLNEIFDHNHDATAFDGHVAKINLTAAAEVDGVLPLANVAAIGSSNIVDNSSFALTTVTAVLNAIKTIIDALVGDKTRLSGTMLLRGFSDDQNINFYAQLHQHRVGSDTATEVLLFLPEVYGESNNASLVIVSSSIPAELRPASNLNQFVAVSIEDNGQPISGTLTVLNTGDWLLRRYDNAVFSSSGTKGIQRQWIRYLKSNV
jgi:hypothetical protein